MSTVFANLIDDILPVRVNRQPRTGIVFEDAVVLPSVQDVYGDDVGIPEDSVLAEAVEAVGVSTEIASVPVFDRDEARRFRSPRGFVARAFGGDFLEEDDGLAEAEDDSVFSGLGEELGDIFSSGMEIQRVMSDPIVLTCVVMKRADDEAIRRAVLVVRYILLAPVNLRGFDSRLANELTLPGLIAREEETQFLVSDGFVGLDKGCIRVNQEYIPIEIRMTSEAGPASSLTTKVFGQKCRRHPDAIGTNDVHVKFLVRLVGRNSTTGR